MRRKAILGGAFDPIHNDHIRMGYGIMYMGLVNEVHYTPCYKHKFGKDMATVDHRLAMGFEGLQEARKKYAMDFRLSREEFRIQHEGSTYEYLTQHIYPKYKEAQDEYYFVIGSDNAVQIEKFHCWQELIKIINFIVVRRDGFMASGNEWFMQKPHRFVDLGLAGLSSTLIRDTIKSQGHIGIKDMVPESVYEYITKHNLYK